MDDTVSVCTTSLSLISSSKLVNCHSKIKQKYKNIKWMIL